MLALLDRQWRNVHFWGKTVSILILFYLFKSLTIGTNILHQKLDILMAHKTPSTHTFPVSAWGGALSKNSSNFPKQTVWHSHPLQAVIGQLCGDEKVGKAWNSLSEVLCFHSLYNYFCQFFKYNTTGVFTPALFSLVKSNYDSEKTNYRCKNYLRMPIKPISNSLLPSCVQL